MRRSDRMKLLGSMVLQFVWGVLVAKVLCFLGTVFLCSGGGRGLTRLHGFMRADLLLSGLRVFFIII